MKIIKYFEDPVFLAKMKYEFFTWNGIELYYWGLGDDGNIYFATFIRKEEFDDIYWSDFSTIAKFVSLGELSRIVKHFGYLLPLL